MIGLLALAFLVVGCKAPPGKIVFNDRMARNNKQLAKLGFDFRMAVAQVQAKSGEVPAVRAKLAEIEPVVSRIKEVYTDALSPINSTPGEAMLTAYQEFVDSQDKIVGKMRQITTALEANRAANVAPLIADIGKLEGKSFEKIEKAQRAYAEEHFYRLVEKYAAP